MRLINIDAFLRREQLFHSGRSAEWRTKVLEFHDETTEYAILSHRWIDSTEVDYEEMVDLAKMNGQEQDEIRGRQGYKKIIDTCKQTKQDGYELLWIDTCCIDKRSSAELSEAINSMYRWYANAKICYAYLHDVDSSSFPTEENKEKYPNPKSNGWPEWFSRGWTLQEMIASRNLQFFNKDWQLIGNKKMLARTLYTITRVPGHILADGLEGYRRPCVAQIISWAAKRTTTRVEDKAYSLMGLLDVNMPMLYGEGKKAFHRLQLEIIRSSNDQSIFAWGHKSDVRIGSILADDPSDFKDCSHVELMNHAELIKEFPNLSSTNADHFDVFPIMNRGIQIWMPLRRYHDSNTVFKAYLPCRDGYGSVMSIDVVLWNSNYYRYPSMKWVDLEGSPEFRQVYLRYQDTPNHTVTFDIDDSAIIENGFTCTRVIPTNLTGNKFTLTNTNTFYVKAYTRERGNGCFEVLFGQCLGLDWVHLDVPCYPRLFFDDTLTVQMPARALSMADTPFQRYSSGRLWVCHLQLPGSTWVVRIYRIALERSRIRLRLEVFRGSQFQNGLDKWNTYDVEVSDFHILVDYYHNHS